MAIWTIAKTTVGEAMRKKVLNVCLIVAVAMIAISLSFTQLGFRQDMTVVKSLGLFIILLAGFVISLILCVSLIPNEVERRTIYTILSKPVRRYEFVVGKFLGGLTTLFINIALMGAVFIIMVAVKTAFSTADPSPQAAEGITAATQAMKPAIFDPMLILGVVLIYFQFLLLSAVVMLFSVFFTPTVNFFASAAVYIVGSAAPVWQSMASKDSNAPGLVKAVYKVVHTIVPNFDYYNIQNKLIHPHHEVRSMPIYTVEIIIYALLFATVAIIVTSLLFDKKEI